MAARGSGDGAYRLEVLALELPGMPRKFVGRNGRARTSMPGVAAMPASSAMPRSDSICAIQRAPTAATLAFTSPPE
jgi:hypothetical protein